MLNQQAPADPPRRLSSRIARTTGMLVLWLTLAGIFVVRFRQELVAAIGTLPQLRLAVLLALLLFGLWTFSASAGWRALLGATLPAGMQRPSLLRLVVIRVQAQAINFIVPTAGLAGESLRAVSAVDNPAAVRPSVVAIVLDNLAMWIAGLTLAASAVPLLAVAAHKSWQVGLLVSAALVALGFAAEYAPFVVAPRLMRVVKGSGTLASLLRILAEERQIRPAYRRAVAWHLLERALSVLEVHGVFLVLGVPATLADSTAIASVFVLTSFAVFFIPAQLGVAELAVVMACISLGISPTVGISIALVRRSRQLTICVLGLLMLLHTRLSSIQNRPWLSRSRAPKQGGVS